MARGYVDHHLPAANAEPPRALDTFPAANAEAPHDTLSQLSFLGSLCRVSQLYGPEPIEDTNPEPPRALDTVSQDNVRQSAHRIQVAQKALSEANQPPPSISLLQQIEAITSTDMTHPTELVTFSDHDNAEEENTEGENTEEENTEEENTEEENAIQVRVEALHPAEQDNEEQDNEEQVSEDDAEQQGLLALQKRQHDGDLTNYTIQKKAKKDVKVRVNNSEKIAIASIMQCRDTCCQLPATREFLLRLTMMPRNHKYAALFTAFPVKEDLPVAEDRISLLSLRQMDTSHGQPIPLFAEAEDVQIEDAVGKPYYEHLATAHCEFSNFLQNLLIASFEDSKREPCSGDVAADTILIVKAMCERWTPEKVTAANSLHQKWYKMLLHNVYDLLKCFEFDPRNDDVEEWLLRIWGCFAFLCVSFFLVQVRDAFVRASRWHKVRRFHQRIVDTQNPVIQADTIHINPSFCGKLFSVKLSRTKCQAKVNACNMAWMLVHVMQLCVNLFARGDMADKMKCIAKDKKIYGNVSLVGLIEHCANKMKLYQHQLSGLVAEKLLSGGVLAESGFSREDYVETTIGDADYLKWMRNRLLDD